MSLAVAANRFFASFALDRILENIVAYAAYEFREEGINLAQVVDLVLFEIVLLFDFPFLDDAFHKL